jgi:hypothetical protein
MSILGEGFDVTISNLMTTDPVSGKLTYTENRIHQGNTTINSKAVIKGDTAFFSGTNSTGVKKIVLRQGVILEATLRSPHLLVDFVQNGSKEKRYEVYEMIKGEIIEKEYVLKGEE